jgi:hypothetical protein
MVDIVVMVDIWLFHPKNFLNFYTFCSKEIFLVLYGCMQPKKRTMEYLTGEYPQDRSFSFLFEIKIRYTTGNYKHIRTIFILPLEACQDICGFFTRNYVEVGSGVENLCSSTFLTSSLFHFKVSLKSRLFSLLPASNFGFTSRFTFVKLSTSRLEQC